MTWEMQMKELKNEGRDEGRKEGRNEARSVFKLFYTGSNPPEIAMALGMKENVVREILG